MPHKGALLAIIYHDQVKAFADKIGQFLRIKLLCHLSKQTDHFIVTVDPRFSFILSLFLNQARNSKGRETRKSPAVAAFVFFLSICRLTVNS